MKFNNPKLDKKRIGLRIKELRKNGYLSMEQLSKDIDVSGKSTISNWEKGLSIPKQDNLKRLADFFHVKTSFILYGNLEEFILNVVSENYNNPLILDVTFELLNKQGKVKYKSDVNKDQVMEVVKDNLDLIKFSAQGKNVFYIVDENNKDKPKELGVEDVIEITHNIIDKEVHGNEYNINNEVKDVKSTLDSFYFDSRNEYDEFIYPYEHDLTLEEFIKENEVADVPLKTLRECIDVYFKIKLDKFVYETFFNDLDKIADEYNKALTEYNINN